MSSPARKTEAQRTGKIASPVPRDVLERLAGKIKTRDEMPKGLITVVYSNPGDGKTKLAAELGKDNLFITTETGHETLKYWPELDAKSRFFRFDPDTGPEDVVNLMLARYKGQLKFDNLVLDTFSGMGERMAHKSLRTNDSRLFIRDSPDLPCLQDYGWAFQMLRPILLAAEDLASVGCSVTVNCHVRFPSPQDEKKGDILSRPDLQKGLFQLANEQANVVGYLHRDGSGKKRLIRVETNGTFLGKKRNRTMPDVMSDVEFIKIMTNKSEIKE